MYAKTNEGSRAAMSKSELTEQTGIIVDQQIHDEFDQIVILTSRRAIIETRGETNATNQMSQAGLTHIVQHDETFARMLTNLFFEIVDNITLHRLIVLLAPVERSNDEMH